MRLELLLLTSAVAFLSSAITFLSVYFQKTIVSASFLLRKLEVTQRQLPLVWAEEGVKTKHRLLGLHVSPE